MYLHTFIIVKQTIFHIMTIFILIFSQFMYNLVKDLERRGNLVIIVPT